MTPRVGHRGPACLTALRRPAFACAKHDLRIGRRFETSPPSTVLQDGLSGPAQGRRAPLMAERRW